MPKFSVFTRFGHLRFSGRPAYGQAIYEDIVQRRGEGKNFSDEWGSGTSARFYAEAMQFARARLAIEHAGEQFLPDSATEMLPKLEREHGLVPGPNDTLSQRRAAVAAAARLSGGASLTNVQAVLTELLGDDFIALVTTDKGNLAEVSGSPAAIGNWVQAGTPSIVGQLSFFVTPTVPPSAITVPIQIISGDTTALHVGATIVVDIGDWNRTEAVTLIAASASSITAVFSKPHNNGTMFRTGRVPNLGSTKRHTAVILSAAAMSSANKRRLVNLALAKLLRGVSTWSLAQATDSHNAGPFTVGHGLLGRTPIGALTY